MEPLTGDQHEALQRIMTDISEEVRKVHRRLAQGLERQLDLTHGTARVLLRLIESLRGEVHVLTWALRRKGLLTADDLANARAEMQAALEVERALDPEAAKAFDELKRAQEEFDRLRRPPEAP